VFNTSLLSSMELSCTVSGLTCMLFRFYPEINAIYLGLTCVVFRCYREKAYCVLASLAQRVKRVILPQVVVHIVLTCKGFPESTTTLGSSCRFGSEQKACLKSATMVSPLCRYLHNVRRSRLWGLAVHKAQKVNSTPLWFSCLGSFHLL
jgi:hypothetical protein